jgi:hypothetical protein
VKEVYRRPPERRPRHCGGRDGGAGTISPYHDEGGHMRERHLSRRTGREDVDAACRSMTAPWVIARAERAQRRRGGDRRGGRRMRQGGGDAVVGGVAAAVGDNGEDEGGGRWHQATTNPVMATMAVVADDDGVGGRRRR